MEPAAVHLIPAIDTGAGRSTSSLGVGVHWALRRKQTRHF